MNLHNCEFAAQVAWWYITKPLTLNGTWYRNDYFDGITDAVCWDRDGDHLRYTSLIMEVYNGIPRNCILYAVLSTARQRDIWITSRHQSLSYSGWRRWVTSVTERVCIQRSKNVRCRLWSRDTLSYESRRLFGSSALSWREFSSCCTV